MPPENHGAPEVISPVVALPQLHLTQPVLSAGA